MLYSTSIQWSLIDAGQMSFCLLIFWIIRLHDVNIEANKLDNRYKLCSE